MAHHAFGRVEEGFAQSHRHAAGGTFDDTAYRILRSQRLFDDFGEPVRIGTASDFGEHGVELDFILVKFLEDQFGYYPGRNQSEG